MVNSTFCFVFLPAITIYVHNSKTTQFRNSSVYFERDWFLVSPWYANINTAKCADRISSWDAWFYVSLIIVHYTSLPFRYVYDMNVKKQLNFVTLINNSSILLTRVEGSIFFGILLNWKKMYYFSQTGTKITSTSKRRWSWTSTEKFESKLICSQQKAENQKKVIAGIGTWKINSISIKIEWYNIFLHIMPASYCKLYAKSVLKSHLRATVMDMLIVKIQMRNIVNSNTTRLFFHSKTCQKHSCHGKIRRCKKAWCARSWNHRNVSPFIFASHKLFDFVNSDLSNSEKNRFSSTFVLLTGYGIYHHCNYLLIQASSNDFVFAVSLLSFFSFHSIPLAWNYAPPFFLLP